MADLVKVGEESVSLAELAGLDITGFKEQRFEAFPVGEYVWECLSDPLPQLEAIGDKPAIKFNFKCIDVIAMKDKNEAPDGDPMKMIGKVHVETFFINDPVEVSIGYLKAFVHDAGGQANGQLNPVAASLAGKRLQAPIIHRKDKNDTDKVYVNLNRAKMKPLPDNVSEVAGKVAA